MSVKIDYATYLEISEDLQCPIIAEGLDLDTLKRLYLSKLVYLKNLRRQCFLDVNGIEPVFQTADLKLITDAIDCTNSHIRNLVLNSLEDTLSKIHKVS